MPDALYDFFVVTLLPIPVSFVSSEKLPAASVGKFWLPYHGVGHNTKSY